MNGAAIAESGTHGWSEFEERELQQMKSISLDMHAMWQTMDLSSSTPVHRLTSTMTTTASKFSSLEEHSSLLRPTKTATHANHDGEIREVQTLQLFPLCSDDGNGANGTNNDRNVPIRTINTTFTPSQFFEFLPLKNWKETAANPCDYNAALNCFAVYAMWLICSRLFSSRRLGAVLSVHIMLRATVG